MQATERVQKECLLKMHLDLLEELNKYSGFVQFFHFRQKYKAESPSLVAHLSTDRTNTLILCNLGIYDKI